MTGDFSAEQLKNPTLVNHMELKQRAIGFATITFRPPNPHVWLIVEEGGVTFFDEIKMRRIAAGESPCLGNAEWVLATAIAAVLDCEREKASRINKTEL